MTTRDPDCLMCELERVLIARSNDLREALAGLDPVHDRRYDVIFRWLVVVDVDLRKLRGARVER